MSSNHRYPQILRTEDPTADAEAYASKSPDIWGHCEECGGRVYRGLDYIEMDGILLHNEYECIMNYVQRNYKKC
jgi:hypothetical protein